MLVRLLGGEGSGADVEDVPGVLCALVAESAELQQAATDADAIAKLAVFVRDGACPLRRKASDAVCVLGLGCGACGKCMLWRDKEMLEDGSTTCQESGKGATVENDAGCGCYLSDLPCQQPAGPSARQGQTNDIITHTAAG